MAPDNAERIARIAQAIRDYLASYPDAADTAEGILRWWLTPDEHEESLQAVDAALGRLIRDRVIQKQVHEDGTVFYRANPRIEPSE